MKLIENTETQTAYEVNEVITSIRGLEQDSYRVIIHTTNYKIELYHEQECCESVWLEDVNGRLEVGMLLKQIKIKTNSNNPSNVESSTWTFITLVTDKGYCDLRFVGESNGYYSEDVTLSYKTLPIANLYITDINNKSNQYCEISFRNGRPIITFPIDGGCYDVLDEIKRMYKFPNTISKVWAGNNTQVIDVKTKFKLLNIAMRFYNGGMLPHTRRYDRFLDDVNVIDRIVDWKSKRYFDA